MLSKHHLRRIGPWALGLCSLLALSPADAGPPTANGDRKLERMVRSCKRCHEDVMEEWQGSAHAESWTSPRFQALVAERDDGGDACARCHAPQTMVAGVAGEIPRARDAERALGVTCLTCHVEGRDYYGPIASKGHGGVHVDPRFRSSEWCASCHGHDEACPCPEQYTSHRESPSAAAGQSCQSCHMPEVERELVKSKRVFEDALPPQKCRTHSFAVVDEGGLLKGALEAEAVLEGESLRVLLRPHPGHRMAVADEAQVRVRATFVDASLQVLGARDLTLAGDAKAELQPGQDHHVTLEAPAGAARAQVRVELVLAMGDAVPLVRVLAAEEATRAE